MLEVFEKRPSHESDMTPVLFVHGAWHGAWCWDEHFLDFFADKGYLSLAVSLREPRDNVDRPNRPSLRAAARCGACVVALLGIVVWTTTCVALLAIIRIWPCSAVT